jgi:hypothetical protein
MQSRRIDHSRPIVEVFAWALMAFSVVLLAAFALFAGGLHGLALFLLGVSGVCFWSAFVTWRRGRRRVEPSEGPVRGHGEPVGERSFVPDRHGWPDQPRGTEDLKSGVGRDMGSAGEDGEPR